MAYEAQVLSRLLDKLEKLQVITTEEKHEIADLRRIEWPDPSDYETRAPDQTGGE